MEPIKPDAPEIRILIKKPLRTTFRIILPRREKDTGLARENFHALTFSKRHFKLKSAFRFVKQTFFSQWPSG